MLRIRKMRFTGYLASLLVLLMQFGPATQVMAAKSAPPMVAAHRVVVFPFATDDTVTQPDLGRDSAHTLTALLQSNSGYSFVDYYRRHPSVQRAVLVENTLSEKDVANPSGIDNIDIASKIAREMGADMAIVGNLRSYNYDATAKTCVIEADVDLVDTRTGKASKGPIVVIGEVPKTAKVTTEAECASVATGDAIKKVVEGLAFKPSLAVQAQAVGNTGTKKRSGGTRLLVSLLVGLGVGLAFNGGSSSGGGAAVSSGSENPPPLPF
jgi:hypothetical protein